MFKNEYLSCIIDRGRIKSIGRFVTRHGETIELGLCQFDGAVSGFRWHEDKGWEPIFVQEYIWSKNEAVVQICTWTEGNHYSEEEIAVEVDRFFAEQRRSKESESQK